MTATLKRLLLIHARPTSSCPGRLTICAGRGRESYYWMTGPSNAGGVYYSLEHESGDEKRRYHVILDQTGDSCDCKGFKFAGHCKHVASLAQLTARDAASAQMPPAAPSCRVCKGTGFKRFETETAKGLTACVACDDGTF